MRSQSYSRVTRRQFIQCTSGAMATLGLGQCRHLLAQAVSAGSGRLPAFRDQRQSVVAWAQSTHVAVDSGIRTEVLSEMFEGILHTLTGAESIQDAWGHFLKTDEVIGIRVNCIGDDVLQTALPLMRILLKSLLRSGWSREQIVVMDAPNALIEEFQVRRFDYGWSGTPIVLGGQDDYLSAFVDQVSSIINIPFLKTDNVLGMSSALKNISYHLIKHPARYHHNGGSPFLGDILAHPDIRGKVRLNLVNALRTVFNDGPLVDPACVDHTGLLLAGSDPLAVDATALEFINRIRVSRGLHALSLDRHVPALADAATRGLGQVDFRKIKRLSAF